MTATRPESERAQLLAVSSAASRLDCSRGHVYHLIAAGKLRAVDIKATGSRPKTRVYEKDLDDYIAQNTRTA
ncbi:helix-turn-helix domain-containing protein [Nocardioides sp. LML1-1-1.1]|uniref:helix-turn-helix domain-containing protein n=1 Tax=Nocardioides sp. LML1-1-1.1 TaxID=3135248 RepID=UPI00343DCFBD